MPPHRPVVTQASVMVSALLVTAGAATAQARSDTASAAAAQSLKRFLQTSDSDRTTQYVAAFRDLNGDGIPEAIVYLVGREWCGSGGCPTLILSRDAGSWRLVTRITLTRPPIRVLAGSSHGWRSIGVWVQGGGVRSAYEAELRFDGRSYPRNPSVAPSRRLKASRPGDVVINSMGDATALW